MAAFQHDLFALFDQAMRKRCSACREVKELAAFSRSRCERDGLKRQCKACCKAMRHDWYLRNRDSLIAATVAYGRANPERIREYNSKAHAKARERYNAQKLARYHANKVSISAGRRQRYRMEPAHRARRLSLSAEHRRLKGPALNAASIVWRRKNRAKVRENWIAWALRNPETARVAAVLGQQRRRARVRNLPDKLDAGTWKRVQHLYGNVCAYCLTAAEKLTVDHILPISRGGTNAEENLAPACGPCNSSKSDRTPLEYLTGIRLT